MRGDNITPAEWDDVRRSWTDGNGVPPWVHLVEVPPDTDEGPWLWTCGECGRSMPRPEVAAHDHVTRRGWIVVAAVIGIAALVVLLRWPK